MRLATFKPLRVRLGILLLLTAPALVQAQDNPPLWTDDFETVAPGLPFPEGWYNTRSATRVEVDAPHGHVLRIEEDKPGRPTRASHAFGVDGQSLRAVRIGLWVRVANAQAGERVGEWPGLIVDFLRADVRVLARAVMGPWRDADLGADWIWVEERFAVPPETRDAILTVGLRGATGRLEVDDFRVIGEPRTPAKTDQLLPNGGFELGTVQPALWSTDPSARRVSPGFASPSALALSKSGSVASAGLALDLPGAGMLEVEITARGDGLRGTSAATADLVRVDPDGRPRTGPGSSLALFRWGGRFDWKTQRARIPIRAPADRVVLRILKSDAAGTLLLDEVSARFIVDGEPLTWTPAEERDRTSDWTPYTPVDQIEPGSALDLSHLVHPANAPGPRQVTVKDGHLVFEDGTPARFLGVTLLPLALAEPDRADALAARLAASGVNLCRLAALDMQLGPGATLFDETRDDTRALDPAALARFDHLIAALKAQGIHVAIEIQNARQFRAGDEVPAFRSLPPGGGPAAGFAPEIRQRGIDLATLLLTHKNPETGLTLAEDPVLAWVTLAGELSIFDLLDDPTALPEEYQNTLRQESASRPGQSGRRLWQTLESEQWAAEALALRNLGVKSPIAGSSHWRRDPEFNAASAAEGLDLIDDRLYWPDTPWTALDRLTPLWDEGPRGLAALVGKKRRDDRAYVVGDWASRTGGAWALPSAGVDLLLGAATARIENWDALVRRGLFLFPESWGAAPAGVVGGRDLFPLPEVINANPAVFHLLPHAASILLADRQETDPPQAIRWTPGLLTIQTDHTLALAGSPAGRRSLATPRVGLELLGDFGVMAASTVDGQPLESTERILITLIGRVQPTGYAWTDPWRRHVADPGHPPLLLEPLRGTLTLLGSKPAATLHPLDTGGARQPALAGRPTASGLEFDLDTSRGSCNFELLIPR